MWILLDLFHKKIDLQENNVSRDRPLIVRLTWASVGLACKDRLDCCSAGRETRGSGKRFDIVCGERPFYPQDLTLAKAYFICSKARPILFAAGIWVIQTQANQVPYHGPYQEPVT